MRLRRTFLAAVLLTGACATQFTGSAYFPGGAAGCRTLCERVGLAMSGFIYSGEFASSCVCRPPPTQPTRPPVSEDDRANDVTDTNDVAGAVGVILRMREAAAQQQQQHQQQQPRR